jgi:hypothetical protein
MSTNHTTAQNYHDGLRQNTRKLANSSLEGLNKFFTNRQTEKFAYNQTAVIENSAYSAI